VSGVLLDRPGSYVRGKVSKCWPVLSPILSLIEQGREWQQLGKHPWRSLEEMATANPLVHDTMALLRCNTYPSFWRLLRQAQPGLRKSVMLIKGDREPTQAVKAARRILGWDNMAFEKRIHSAHPRTQMVLDPDYKYHYKFEQLVDNVYVDAGKADPKKWMMSQRVISSVGYMQSCRWGKALSSCSMWQALHNMAPSCSQQPTAAKLLLALKQDYNVGQTDLMTMTSWQS